MTSNLEISLFGPCVVRVSGPDPVEIRGAKHRGLLALLATAPMGRRSRTFLQTTLWGVTDYDSGHQNLRRALADLRKRMGPAFADLIQTTNSDVELVMEHVRFIGDPDGGAFLEDLNIADKGFADWAAAVRAAPDAALGLYRIAPMLARGRPRPRVTVLPLAVLGSDPQHRVLADWVAEEAGRSLSRSNLLSVISHLSSRAMAARMVDIAAVRQTLEVDYVLSGTLRAAGGNFAIDFDFVDAASGEILWNRHLTSPQAHFLEDLQRRLANVVQTVGRSIADAAIAYVRDRPIPQVDDHRLLIAGVSLMHRAPLRDFLASHDYLIEATARLGKTAEAHAWLGKWYALNVFKGFTNDRAKDTQRALDCTARALDTDPHSSFSLTIDGFAHSNLLKDTSTAEQRFGAALDLNPNESLSWLMRGSVLAFQDQGDAAIRAAETACSLSPIDPFGYYYDSLAASAYLSAGDHQRALERAESSLRVNNRHLSTLRARIAALHYLDRADEARDAAADLKRRFPDFTIEGYRREHPSALNTSGKRVIAALQAAGIQ